MFLILTILEGILIITGFFCLRKGGPVILYFLLLISIVDFINENLIITHCMYWWKIQANVFYNLYSFVEILCWIVIYYQIYKKTTIKGIILYSGFFILFLSVFEVFVFYSPEVFHTISYSSFSMFSLCFSGIYLYKINNTVYHNLIADPVFWICAGAACFNAVFLVNLATMLDPDYWQQTKALEVFHILQSVALIIYYIFLWIAFTLFYYMQKQEITPSL